MTNHLVLTTTAGFSGPFGLLSPLQHDDQFGNGRSKAADVMFRVKDAEVNMTPDPGVTWESLLGGHRKTNSKWLELQKATVCGP